MYTTRSLILVHALGLFSYCWFACSIKTEWFLFALLYFILLCLLSPKSLYFSNERRKGNGSREKWTEEELGV